MINNSTLEEFVMKKRSVTVKNVTGSLLGGISGILAFGYIHPIALPIGCLFGVLIGWWYEEIWVSAVEGWRASMSMFCGIPKSTVSAVTAFKNDICNMFLDFLRAMRSIFVGIINAFLLPCKWFGNHPMNQIFVIRICAIIASIEVSALWLMPICFKIGDMSRAYPTGSDPQALLMLAQMMLVIIVVMSSVMYLVASSEDMNLFYAIWERYEKKGAVLFFFDDVKMIIVSQIIFFIYLACFVVWFATAGGFFLIAIIAPLSLMIGAVKGVYAVSARSGHLLCLGVTLCVTIFSAWLMHEYFANVQILWITALAAGVVSAGVTEGMRRVIVWCCDRNVFLTNIVSTRTSKQLAPSGRVFMKFTSFAHDLCLSPVDHYIHK